MVADFVDGYLFLRNNLNILLSKGTVSELGSDEEYRKAQVVVGMLYLFWDIALKVTQNFKSTTNYLLQYLHLFVPSKHGTRVLLC